MEALARRILDFRFAIWVIVILGVGGLWWTSRPIEFDQSIEGFFPADHPALVAYEKAKRSFGSDDFVFVVYDDARLWTAAGIDRVAALAEALGDKDAMRGVERVDSLDRMPIPWKVDAAAEAATTNPFALAKLLGGLSTVGSEVRGLADDADAIAEFRRRLCANPLFENAMVDSAGRATALVLKLKDASAVDPKQTVSNIRRIADRFAEEHMLGRIAVVGPPVLLTDGFISLDKDNHTLGVVAMALMAVTMLVGVRSPWWAVLPLASGWATWLVTQWFMTHFEMRLTLSSGPIIAQTVVLCMPAASHLAMHFRQASKKGTGPICRNGPEGASHKLDLSPFCSRDEAARHTLVEVFVPVAWCSITAAAGYLALLTSSVRPVFQFGLTMAVCNLLAGAIAYLLAAGAMQPPRWFSRRTNARPLPLPLGEGRGEGNPDADCVLDGPRPNPLPEVEGTRSAESRVGGMTSWVIHHPILTLAIFVVPCLGLATGIAWLKFESNYMKAYRASSRIATDYRFVEERLGGIGLVELVFPAPEKITLEWLDSLRATTNQLRSADSEVIATTLSLADVLLAEPREVDSSKSTAAPPPAESPAPPKSSGALGGLLGRPPTGAATPAPPDKVLDTKLRVLKTGAYVHFLDNFWDRSGSDDHPAGWMRVLVRIREGADADRKERALEELARLAGGELSRASYLTGLSHLMAQITRAIITTQFQSTALACGLILLMLLAALRNIPLSVLALVPTLLAVALVLGAMGWLGLKVDMSTALVASVATGLSVDDTFHCLLRWKREIRSGLSSIDALRAAYAGAGPGVVLSSAAVSLGFLALVFSEFVPTANFGWLVAVATLGGSAGNLIVLPAFLALWHRPNSAAAV